MCIDQHGVLCYKLLMKDCSSMMVQCMRWHGAPTSKCGSIEPIESPWAVVGLRALLSRFLEGALYWVLKINVWMADYIYPVHGAHWEASAHAAACSCQACWWNFKICPCLSFIICVINLIGYLFKKHIGLGYQSRFGSASQRMPLATCRCSVAPPQEKDRQTKRKRERDRKWQSEKECKCEHENERAKEIESKRERVQVRS